MARRAPFRSYWDAAGDAVDAWQVSIPGGPPVAYLVGVVVAVWSWLRAAPLPGPGR